MVHYGLRCAREEDGGRQCDCGGNTNNLSPGGSCKDGAAEHEAKTVKEDAGF